MDARAEELRACAAYLEDRHHGGDHEVACLERSAHLTLELMADVLERCGSPRVRGYKDACDKIVEFAGFARELAETLKQVLDVAERMPRAWSTIHPGDLATALRQGSNVLRRFADEAERILGAPEATEARPD